MGKDLWRSDDSNERYDCARTVRCDTYHTMYVTTLHLHTIINSHVYTNPGSTDVCQAERRTSRRREDRAYDILNSRLILERRFSAKSRHDVISRPGPVACEIFISLLKTKLTGN